MRANRHREVVLCGFGGVSNQTIGVVLRQTPDILWKVPVAKCNQNHMRWPEAKLPDLDLSKLLFISSKLISARLKLATIKILLLSTEKRLLGSSHRSLEEKYSY